jgi:hypothetical protein
VVAPVLDEYVPATQDVQNVLAEAADDVEKVPAAQFTH